MQGIIYCHAKSFIRSTGCLNQLLTTQTVETYDLLKRMTTTRDATFSCQISFAKHGITELVLSSSKIILIINPAFKVQFIVYIKLK